MIPWCPAVPAAPLAGVEAVVLVGGLGTRMRPLTLSAPKPMLPTAGVPLLCHLLARIRAAGVAHVVLGTSYRAEVFASHFGANPPPGRSRCDAAPGAGAQSAGLRLRADHR